MRRLAALLALCSRCSLVAGCGEKDENAPGGGKTEKFNIILDYFPNADHAGIYAAQAAGDYARAGLDVEIKPPPDPSAPLKLLQSGPRRPRHLLRARAAARARQGRRPRVGRRARPEAADHADVAEGHHAPRGPRRQARRHRRAPLPVGLPEDDPRATRASIPTTVKETNVGFNLVPGDALRQGRRDARRVLELRGRGPQAPRAPPEDPAHGEARRADLRRAVFVARRKDLDEGFSSKLRRFLRATARGHQRLRENPELGVDALLKVDPGLERGLQTAVVSATLPGLLPRPTRTKPFGWQEPERVGRLRALDVRRTSCSSGSPTRHAALTNEFLPGAGAATRGPPRLREQARRRRRGTGTCPPGPSTRRSARRSRAPRPRRRAPSGGRS